MNHLPSKFINLDITDTEELFRKPSWYTADYGISYIPSKLMNHLHRRVLRSSIR
eukprot:SAG11_NODE_36782_length_260_cov_0.440994_1_plen_53_part_10